MFVKLRWNIVVILISRKFSLSVEAGVPLLNSSVVLSSSGFLRLNFPFCRHHQFSTKSLLFSTPNNPTNIVGVQEAPRKRVITFRSVLVFMFSQSH
jgi:hypothetical protein